jgi:phosphate:Na+ symporter
MSGSVLLLHLAGAVALLLWATRMVRTGVERAYGDVLRERLRKTLRNPVLAAGAGMGLAVALQSATAVCLLVGSFVGSGMVAGASGIIAVLGADLGSAIVVKILSFDLEILIPVLLVSGTTIFMSTERRKWTQFGRILIGVGLLLLSLRLIGAASEPLRESEILPVIINYLANDPVTAFLLAAVMTWLFHSSVAAVLLIAALVARGLVPVPLGIVLVLGANFGAGIIAAVLSRAAPPIARLVPVGNLIVRSAGAIIALALFLWLAPPAALLGSDATAQVIHAHLLFNALLLLVGVPLAVPVYRTARAVIELGTPVPADAVTLPGELSALDDKVLDRPSQALANATREVVRVCETIEIMLQRIIELYQRPDRAKIRELAAFDDRVDRWHAAIKLYLARLDAGQMTPAEKLRYQELIGACIKLEQVGDIIVRNLLAHVQKKLDRKLEFTPEGWQELAEFHAAVLSNAHLAFNVLISRDGETARRLVVQKDRLRDLEKTTSQRHFMRLSEGSAKSVETSSIHLDTIRDLKQINSLLASMAYPVLEDQGLLSGSRLKAV